MRGVARSPSECVKPCSVASFAVSQDPVGESWVGKEVEFTGISIYRIEEGKIAESWNSEDQLGLLLQIGGVADLEQSEEASPT